MKKLKPKRFRKAAYNADGNIDVEIDHPQFGWIPFTVNPADVDSDVDVAALDAAIRKKKIAPYVPPPPPAPKTPAQIDAEIDGEADAALDGQARDKAIALLFADLWRAQNPGMTMTEARAAVKARFKAHLRTIRGV